MIRSPRSTDVRVPAFWMSCVLVAVALLGVSTSARAQLVVYPIRLVLDPAKRADQLEIINNSSKPVTYLITLQNRRMDENGRFSAANPPLPGEQFADGMLRFSPRRVTLEPGKGQVVRIMARRPADLAAGEYRSHLLFSEQPTPQGATSIEKPPGETGSIGVALTALVGISIPIIVRAGETSAAVTLDGVEVVPGSATEPATITVDMHRTGNRSVYGDLVASFEPAGGGGAVDVGKAAGIAVYTPNALRHVRFMLNLPANTVLSGGTVTATFRERDGSIMARTSTRLP